MHAGLVPSINNVNASGRSSSKGEFLEVDAVKARCTRLRKNLGVSAKLLSNSGTRQPWMVTLTYADALGWKPDHIRDCLRLMRQWAHRNGFKLRYLWVMETKARKTGEQAGTVAPHYHLVIWLPHRVDCPYFDARGWWPHGLTNAVKAVAAVRYVMKYASKFDNEGAFPKGARCYGIGGLSDADARVRRWLSWPAFVQARSGVNDSARRATGGGWIVGSAGEWFPSEWGLVYRTSTGPLCVRLHDHGRPVEACGPWSNLESRHSAGYAAGAVPPVIH